MPNTNTAKKNLRQNIRRRVINKKAITAISSLKKKITQSIAKNQDLSEKDAISLINNDLSKLHSKSRKNRVFKLRASKFESKVITQIKSKSAEKK